MDEQKIKNILVRGNYVSPKDLKEAEDFARTHHTSIVYFLLSKQLITNDLVGQAIAESHGVPYADLNSHQPTRELAMRIPERLARDRRVVPFTEDARSITVTTDDPTQEGILQELKGVLFAAKGKVEKKKIKKIVLTYSLTEDIDEALLLYRKPLETRFAGIIKEQTLVAPKLIDEIFEDALRYRASDIHFEPQGSSILIRFRVDGVLQEAGSIPRDYYDNILNRIKVQSLLRIDEHFSAQDGAMRYIKSGETIDMRVSLIPTLEGEKIVIRLLAHYVRGFGLVEVGLSPHDQLLIETAAKMPFGMILVTGPTGSGKTTTLYALLRMLNSPEENITTIEDPVEYKMKGVNQIQVNAATNLTFAKGLRSIVRQDPDIILVGEIRDGETAEISVNAALTGHLLLSTFHANDASTAPLRLLKMGIEPYLLASTLEMVIAQRLVRKICEGCRVTVVRKKGSLEKITPFAREFFPKDVTLYKGKGCAECHSTGYKGRTAIFEILSMTPAMKELLLQRPSVGQVQAQAKKQGTVFLFEDGINKVKGGVTTIEEVLRVANPSISSTAV